MANATTTKDKKSKELMKELLRAILLFGDSHTLKKRKKDELMRNDASSLWLYIVLPCGIIHDTSNNLAYFVSTKLFSLATRSLVVDCTIMEFCGVHELKMRIIQSQCNK